MLKSRLAKFISLTMLALLASCNIPNPLESFTEKPKQARRLDLLKANDSDFVSKDSSYLLLENPIIASGDEKFSASDSFQELIDTNEFFITSNDKLTNTCGLGDSSSIECIEVKGNSSEGFLGKNNSTWAYDPDTLEFLQVNSYYHLNKQINRFLETVQTSMTEVSSLPIDKQRELMSSIPTTLKSRKAFWNSTPLKVYTNCESNSNAYFKSASFELCFGVAKEVNGLVFSQDPSVVYHEMGHALTTIMLNMRNVAGALDPSYRVILGQNGYDESGAIGEGVSDYFSYLMNERASIGEWALGRYYKAARPIHESEHAKHGASGQKLVYPNDLSFDLFRKYKLNQTDYEDIHFAGQITSHYLTSLTLDLRSSCGMNHETASSKVLQVLMETLAELGDLTSRGSDFNQNNHNINMKPVSVKHYGSATQLWYNVNNPVNYRSFYQTFAKKLLLLSNAGLVCQSGSYSKNKIETLLDEYGLLLFNNYNIEGSSVIDTDMDFKVNPANRRVTVLANKSALSIDSRTQEVGRQAAVVDARGSTLNPGMKSVIDSYFASGKIDALSEHITNNIPYNNGNGRIDRGEVVGLILNVFNNANVPLGGVQILGNDWDHVKQISPGKYKPCELSGFPSVEEGGVPADDANIPGNCAYTSRNAGRDLISVNGSNKQVEFYAPICLVKQVQDETVTWITQGDFANMLAGFDPSRCLHENTNDPDRPAEDCFLRVVPGADQAHFSKINPASNWKETIPAKEGLSGELVSQFSASNMVIFEVSPDVPAGTTFNCRFRARFSNCEDCYVNDEAPSGDDRLDYENGGHKAYKIIDFQFSIVE